MKSLFTDIISSYVYIDVIIVNGISGSCIRIHVFLTGAIFAALEIRDILLIWKTQQLSSPG